MADWMKTIRDIQTFFDNITGYFKDSPCDFLYDIFGGSRYLQLYFPPEMMTRQLQTFGKSMVEFCKPLKLETVDEREKLKEDQPFAVACPNFSRLEADINQSLRNIKWTREYLILVIHFGSASSLPALKSELTLPKSSYKGAKFVDVAFNETDKIYPHKINYDARKDIKNFVENFNKK